MVSGTTNAGKSIPQKQKTSHSHHHHGRSRAFKTKLILGLFSVFLAIDLFFREDLYNLSVQHETIIRSKYATPQYDKLATIISEFGDKYMVGVLIYISYHLLDNSKAFIILFAAIICQAFSCFLKGLYHEARPFFIGDFRSNGCRFEYGNPSGHSFIATGLYITVWDLFCRQYHPSNKVKYGILAYICTFIVVLGASRIYNGVHTYNQVLSGYSWGLLTYGVLCHIYYEQICHLVHSQIKTENWKWLVWNPITQLFIGTHMLAIATYFYNKRVHPIPEGWSIKIQQNCHSNELTLHDIELHNYLHFHFSWAFIGGYLGLVVDQRYFKTSTELDHFNQTSLSNTLKRILICAPPLILSQLPMLLVSKHASVLKLVLIKTMLPTFTGSFMIFGFTKIMGQNFGVVKTTSQKKKTN